MTSNGHGGSKHLSLLECRQQLNPTYPDKLSRTTVAPTRSIGPSPTTHIPAARAASTPEAASYKHCCGVRPIGLPRKYVGAGLSLNTVAISDRLYPVSNAQALDHSTRIFTR